jgi:hypothetical protein
MPRARAGLGGLAPPVIAAQAVMANAGTPTPAHLRYAKGLRVAIPASLQAAVKVKGSPS